MRRDRVLGTMHASAHPARENFRAERESSVLPSREERPGRSHPTFRAAWYATNVLLILSILLAAYSVGWEYSTRRYLKGFSDAVVPESSSDEDKIEAILSWMANGPARQAGSPDLPSPYRNPMDTLNYTSLLQVCGSATNGFVNLADSAGMSARRLLLLDSRRMTKHVVAEVLVDGRWIVVDPAYRTILRGADGRLLTREDLVDPTVWAEATRGIKGYSPEYTFDRTAHVRLARVPFIGQPLRSVLDPLLPGWEDSMIMTLFLERESLAMIVLSIILVAFSALLRIVLRWCGERYLGVQPLTIWTQFRQALHAFLETTG